MQKSHCYHSVYCTPFPFTLLAGHLPFHTIATLTTVHRKRRDVEAEGSSDKLAFSLRLSNMTYSFEMSHGTDLLSPRYVLEEVAEDGRLVTVPSTVKGCYYIQDIRQTGLSAATVCSHTVVSNVPSSRIPFICEYCTVQRILCMCPHTQLHINILCALLSDQFWRNAKEFAFQCSSTLLAAQEPTFLH